MLHDLPKVYWVNLDPSAIRREGCGTSVEISQILLNYARSSRGPWRLKALLDRDGHAFTSGFIAVRPRKTNCSLEYLWALCNSPVANAFAYAHLSKRDNLVKTLRRLPVPAASVGEVGEVEQAATSYLSLAGHDVETLQSEVAATQLREAMQRVDALVLRLYDLPPRLERQLLDVFAGYQRPGVPFKFDRYFPEGYQPCFPYHEFLSAEYRRSTAGNLAKCDIDMAPPGFAAALSAAVERYSE